MALKQQKKSSPPVVKSSAPPAAPAPKTQPPSSDRIAVRAYEIWQESGCPNGQDVEHWYRAERELRAPAAR